MRALLLVPLLFGCPVDEAADPPPPCAFRTPGDVDLVLTDVAADAGAQDPDGVNNGLAAEDFDGDGDVDLYLANPGPRPQLLLRDGDGYRAHPAPPAAATTPAASAVDFDGDGDVDLYLACGRWDGPCGNALMRNDGLDADGFPVFTDVTQAMGLWDPSVSTFGGAWADYDRDGDLDLFQACKRLDLAPDVDSADQLYRNDGDRFVEVGVAAGVAGEGDSHQAAWLDVDADGWPDLFVPVRAGANVLYRNRGDGTFEDVSTDALREPWSAFAAVAFDIDQDGFQDLLVSGRTIGQGPGALLEEHGLFLNDGAGGFEDWTEGTGLNDDGDGATHIGTMGLQVGDLDGDGFPEIAFGTGDPDAGERNALGSFVPDGEGVRWVDRSALIDDPGQGAGLAPWPFRTHGMAMADLDGDGDVDLYLGNGGGPHPEPNQLWSNRSEARNHALRLQLRSASANTRGIGARIRVSDGPPERSSWASYRTVEASSGFNSSRPAALQIGLGRCPGQYHVTVDWPGGGEQVLEGVPEASDVLVIDEE